MSSPVGSGYTDPTAAYYLDQVRRYIAQNKTQKSASNAYTPMYGVDITDSSTVTDSVTTTNMGTPATFMVTGDKTAQKLFLELDRDTLDGSDNNHTLTITGNETYATGPKISPQKGIIGFSFDGSTDLTSNVEGDYDIERTAAMSISFWASWTSASIMMIVTKMTATANTGYEIGTTAAGKIRIRLINTATTNEIDVISPLAYNDGVWRHFTFTKSTASNAAGCKLYVN